MSFAILSGYVGLFTLFKIKSALTGSKEEEPVKVVESTITITSSGVPGIESPEFEKFLETEAFEKLLENDSALAKVVESA